MRCDGGVIACTMRLTIPAQLIVVAVVRCAIACTVRVIIPVRLIAWRGGGVLVV